MKLLFSRALLACAFFFSSASAETFVENDGILIMEAESSAAAGAWDLERSIGGYSGTGYLRWNGADFFGSPGNGTITYRFRIQRAGNYELLWRSRITRGDNRTEHNDSWARFPTGRNIDGQHGLNGWTKVFMSTLNEWAWQSATVDNVGRRVRQYFSAGEHTMQISGRSNGHAIDRIALFNYTDNSISSSRFDSISSAGTTTGSASPVNPPEPAPAPAPAPQPIPESSPELVASVDAPVVSVSGDTLSWPGVDAVAINVHRGGGAWLESLAGDQTQWRATEAGNYFIVATGAGSWETWGRSDTVTVEDSARTQGGVSTGELLATVYSSSALELFWVSEDSTVTSFEVRRNDELLAVTDGRSYFDDGLRPATQYIYTLTGIDSAGNAIVETRTSVSTPSGSDNSIAADNGGLNLQAEVYSQSALEVFWSTDVNSLPADTLFEVYLGSEKLDTINARSYFVDGLNAGTDYDIVLIALDAAGSALLIESVTATTFAVDSQ